MSHGGEKSYLVDAQGVAMLVIGGGGPLNIVCSALARSLAATLRAMAQDPVIRAVVIRGSGEKTFIGGADIREMAVLSSSDAREFIAGLHALCEAARDLPVPSLAAIHGWCIGVGLELAAACDLRIASTDAHFTMPEVRIGIPSVIQGAFLSRLVGEGRARWLMLTGQAVDASTALQWGLVNEVVDPACLEDAALRCAREMAGFGAAGMRAQKRVLRFAEIPHLDAAMRYSIEAFGAPYQTSEPAELMQAFLQRKTGARP
jgi:enoyl-CoA hydratase/carnithine racemase